MPDPMLLAAVPIALFALTVLVATGPRLTTMITIAVVVLFPKLDLVPVPGTTLGLRIEDVLLAVLAIRIVSDLAGRRTRIPPSLWVPSLWLLALLPVGLLGIALGLNDNVLQSPSVALLYLVRRYEYFGLAFAGFLYIRESRHQAQAVALLAMAAVANSLVAIGQKFGIVGGFVDGLYVNVSERVIGLAAGPYELAALLALLLPIFMWRLAHNQRLVTSLAALVLILSALWFTQSRVGQVSVAVILVGLVLVAALRHPAGVVVATFFGALLLLVVAIVSPSAFTAAQSRFATLNPGEMWSATQRAFEARSRYRIGNEILSDTLADQSYAARIDRWFNYVDGLMHYNPFFGLGPSAAGEAVDGNYVRLIIEFGFVGALIFAVFLSRVWRSVRTFPDTPVRAVAAWGGLALLAQATFIDVFEASKVAETYWLIFGLGVASMMSAASASAAPAAPAAPDRVSAAA